MTLPAGISVATIRVGKAFDFFGTEAQITVTVTPILGGNAKRIVWEATGELLANFAGTFSGTVGEQVEFEVPHVDQAGFVDGTGDEFTMWFYRAEISLLIGRQTVQYQQDFQVLVGQDVVDLDLVPDASFGEPVTVTIPEVLSINGRTGVVTLEQMEDDLELASPAGRDRLALADYEALQPWFAALANRRNKRVNVGIMGASLTEGWPVTTFDRTCSAYLAEQLRATYPTPGVEGGGRGFIGAPTPEMAATGMWPTAGAGGASTGDSTGAKHQAWVLFPGPQYFAHALDPDATSLDIIIQTDPNGHATGGVYAINGGALVTFNTYSAVPAIARVHVVLPGDAATINVAYNGGTYVLVDGIQEYAGDEDGGFQVHNLGHSSYSTNQWLVDTSGASPGWADHIAELDLDLLVMQDFGINDGNPADDNRTAAQVKVSLIALIAKLRADGVDCPIVLAASYDVTGAVPLASPWSEYVQAHREIAEADPTVVFLDHSARMPSTVAADTYGLYWLDDVHGATDGAAYYYMGSNIAAAIAPR